MRNALIAFAALLTVGCGIPGSTLLADLTADDATLICDHVDFDGIDQVETCENGATFPADGEAGTVTLAASTYEECIGYFEAVRAAANPDCTGTFDNWKNCKTEPDWDNATVCGVYGGEMEAPALSADCAAVVTCMTPPAQ